MLDRCLLQKISVTILASILLFIPLSSSANNEISYTAAGAHSSWVIMNKIKPILEKISGRKITIFGKQSMLGVGCNAGIKSTKQHPTSKESFGMVCCPLSDREIKKENLDVFPLALEPLMILGHISNPINNLSIKQVKDIFSGKITNWKQVGGEDKSIVVVTRLHCKKRPGHWKTILNSADKFTTTRINVQSADEMVKRIGDFTAGFGHAGRAWLRGKNSNTKIIRVDGYLPTSNNLKKSKYPFFRQLSLITNKEASSELKKLMRNAQVEVFNNAHLFSEYEILPIDPATH